MGIKPLDIIITLIILILITIFSLNQLFSKEITDGHIFIKFDGEKYLYTGERDRVLTYESSSHKSEVEIVDGRARIVSSTCKDQICVQMGWVENSADFSACLPNKLIIGMEGESGESDAFAY